MLSSKSKPKPKSDTPTAGQRWQFEAIGTQWTIELFEPLGEAAAAQLLRAIQQRIARFDYAYSRFRADSLVTRMAQEPGTYRLPPDAKQLFDLYYELYAFTDGAVTPLIGQVLTDAGYDANYSLQPQQLHRPPSWKSALEYDFPHLTVKQPVLLDLGAAGKGYLVDIIGRLLRRHGMRAWCVDAGGDMRYHYPSAVPLEVGLEHPGRPSEVIGIARLASGQSLCGSAGNRRAWPGFHHIIDPERLVSPQHIRAVWAMANTTLLADALTTALFFVPAAKLAARYTFEYAIVYKDYRLEHSVRFPATFFTEQARVER